VCLVPTAVVRLVRALAQRIHSTQGGLANSPKPGRVVRTIASCESTGTAHPRETREDCGLPWTCGTGRRRSRPANGTCCASAGSIRRIWRTAGREDREQLPGQATRSACGSYLCKTPQIDTTQARVPQRHAGRWGYWRPCLWTTVDPWARRLLSSNLRAAPPHDQPATPAFCGSNSSVTTPRAVGQGYKGPTVSRGIDGIPKWDILAILHNLWTKVWSLGALGSDTTGHSQKEGV
jgi:hypothetical protein